MCYFLRGYRGTSRGDSALNTAESVSHLRTHTGPANTPHSADKSLLFLSARNNQGAFQTNLAPGSDSELNSKCWCGLADGVSVQKVTTFIQWLPDLGVQRCLSALSPHLCSSVLLLMTVSGGNWCKQLHCGHLSHHPSGGSGGGGGVQTSVALGHVLCV